MLATYTAESKNISAFWSFRQHTGKVWYTTVILIAAGCWSTLGIEVEDFVITCIKGAKTENHTSTGRKFCPY